MSKLKVPEDDGKRFYVCKIGVSSIICKRVIGEYTENFKQQTELVFIPKYIPYIVPLEKLILRNMVNRTNVKIVTERQFDSN